MLALQDADLVVDQFQLGELRVDPLQADAHGAVEGVDRAVALRRGDDALALGPQLHRGLVGVGAVGAVLDDGPPGLRTEVAERAALGLLAQEELEGGVGRFVRVAVELALLDAGDDAADQLAVVAQVDAELLALELDGGAARHVGDEHPDVVADQARVDVLVQVGVDLDRGGVQAGLVREGGDADVRLVGGGREVDDLGDGVRDAGHLGERAGREDLLAVLQLQRRDDGEEVGVAHALAVAVGGALDVGGARVDGGEGVGDRAARVVLGVDAQARAGVGEDGGDDGLDLRGEHAAVGVAEDDDVGAGLRGRPYDRLGVLGVGAVAVEEVLAVDEDAAALGAEVGDRVADHRDVLVERRAQGEFDVTVVGLGDQGDDGGAGVQEGRDLRVVRRLGAGAAGGAEGHELRVLEVDLVLRAGEELGVARVGAGPAALDEAHAEVVQVPGDGQLVGDRQIDAFALGAVAQRGVEDVEAVVGEAVVGA